MKLPCSACFQRSYLKTWITAVIVVQCVVVVLYLDVTKSDGQPKLWGIVSRSVFGGSGNDTRDPQTASPEGGAGTRRSRFQAEEHRQTSEQLGRAGRQPSFNFGSPLLATPRSVTPSRNHEAGVIASAIRNYTKQNPSIRETQDKSRDLDKQISSKLNRDINHGSIFVKRVGDIRTDDLRTETESKFQRNYSGPLARSPSLKPIHDFTGKTHKSDVLASTTNSRNEKRGYQSSHANDGDIRTTDQEGKRVPVDQKNKHEIGLGGKYTARDGLVAYLKGELNYKFYNQTQKEDNIIPMGDQDRVQNPSYGMSKNSIGHNSSLRVNKDKVLNPPFGHKDTGTQLADASMDKNEALRAKRLSKSKNLQYMTEKSNNKQTELAKAGNLRDNQLPVDINLNAKSAEIVKHDRKVEPYKSFIVHVDPSHNKEVKPVVSNKKTSTLVHNHQTHVSDVTQKGSRQSDNQRMKEDSRKTVNIKSTSTKNLQTHNDDRLNTAPSLHVKAPTTTVGGKIRDSGASRVSDSQGFTVNSKIIQLPPGEGMENYFTMDGAEVGCFVRGTAKPRDGSSAQRPMLDEGGGGGVGGAGGPSCTCKPNWHGPSCSIPDLVYYSSGAGFVDAMRPRNRSRRIINALAFNVEFELLEARLYELDQVVDVFIIFESNYSNFGEPKPLRLLERLRTGFLKEFHHKIVYILRDYFPDGGKEDGWLVDEHMRTFIGNEGLKRVGNTRPDDIFIYTDADELPSHDALLFLRLHNGFPEPFGFTLRWSVFGFFWKQMDPTRIWAGCTLGMMRYVFHYSAYDVRAGDYFSKHTSLVQSYIKAGGNVFEWYLGEVDMYAGWHCSWCLTPDRIQIKLTSAINADFPRWGDFPEKRKLEYIRGLIKSGTWFDDVMKFDSLTNKNEDTFYAPQHLLLNYDKYKSLLNLDDA